MAGGYLAPFDPPTPNCVEYDVSICSLMLMQFREQPITNGQRIQEQHRRIVAREPACRLTAAVCCVYDKRRTYFQWLCEYLLLPLCLV